MDKPPLADTAEFAVPPHVLEPGPQTLLEVDAAGLSHAGAVRANNEDHFLIARFGRFFEPVETNLLTEHCPSPSREIGYGVLVADGVGGNPAGEVASRLAIQMLVNLAVATPDWIMRLEDGAYVQEVARRARSRFESVNQGLREQAQADPNLRGFATTMTMALSLGTDLLIAHTGDSRAYLFRNNQLHQLTRDHTLAQQLAAQGSIPAEALATHRFRHVLTDALGSNRPIQIDVERIALRQGDCLMLCSDGLTEKLAVETIARVLGQGLDARTSCQTLLDKALNAGGRDNITVAVLRYQAP